MFRKFLNPDNGLMITFAQIGDCVFLSLFWMLCCFPVVTIGASTAALYDCTFRAFRKGDKSSWFRFFRVFKENLKGGILPTLVYLALFFALLLGVIQVWNAAVAGTVSWMLFSGAAFLGAAALGILSVMFPMLSRFDNSFGALMKNTLFLAMANLPGAVGLGVINAVSIFLCAWLVVPVFFLPALSALIGSLFLEPMFKPYMPEENAAD